MLDSISLMESLAALVLIGGALGVLAKILRPALKISDRVTALERHEKANFKMIEKNELANKLLLKALIALLDNRITDNNVDNLKIVKGELIDFITKG